MRKNYIATIRMGAGVDTLSLRLKDHGIVTLNLTQVEPTKRKRVLREVFADSRMGRESFPSTIAAIHS